MASLKATCLPRWKHLRYQRGVKGLELLAPGTCRGSCPGGRARASVCVCLSARAAVCSRPPRPRPRAGVRDPHSPLCSVPHSNTVWGSPAHGLSHFSRWTCFLYWMMIQAGYLCRGSGWGCSGDTWPSQPETLQTDSNRKERAFFFSCRAFGGAEEHLHQGPCPALSCFISWVLHSTVESDP